MTALEPLVLELVDRLATIDVRGTERPLAPWEGGWREPCVLADLAAPAVRPMSLTRGNWASLDVLMEREAKKRGGVPFCRSTQKKPGNRNRPG